MGITFVKEEIFLCGIEAVTVMFIKIKKLINPICIGLSNEH